uniref:Uncharacterized protein n=1 Tax=Panagrellus redivivus TaxID=6233 RepID=A0A7E4V8Y9_PANRE
MFFKVVLLSFVLEYAVCISCYNEAQLFDRPHQKYCIYYKTVDNYEKQGCNGVKKLQQLLEELDVPSAQLNQCYSNSKYNAFLICDKDKCNTPCTPEKSAVTEELSLNVAPNSSVYADVSNNPNNCNCNCEHHSSASSLSVSLFAMGLAFYALLFH